MLYLNTQKFNYRPLSFGNEFLGHGTSPRVLVKLIDTCALCATKIKKEDCRTFEHFLPKILGGKTEFKNGIVTCRTCNTTIKRNAHPSVILEDQFDMEGNLINYLELPEVKKITLPKKKASDPDVFYVDEFRAYAEQVLGRPLKG